ncbi:MAG: 4Fe-4S cluster-binding domain-containing protein, partial [Firmicutes bacterium]|nr:4Fe-4S cluster-binding domain-containing protein [Bacillota bacterium]
MTYVFNIQRYSLHDGNGIRTTIFLKGCPLRCRWCCNPESQSREKEIMYNAGKCIGKDECGYCGKYGFGFSQGKADINAAV